MFCSVIVPFICNENFNEKGEKIEPILLSDITYEIEPLILAEESELAVEIIEIDPYENAINNMRSEMSEIENITDKEEWFISYKSIIEKYSDILDPPETLYDYFTDEELDMFFRVVQAEIGDEYSFEQKANVASVILNRIEHYKFPDEMFEILTSDQFSTIKNGRYKKVEISEETILACEYAFEIEDTTNGCLFFDSNNALKYEFIFNDGAHNFYKIKGE